MTLSRTFWSGLILAGMSVATTSCISIKADTAVNTTKMSSAVSPAAHLMQSVLWQQTSAEYQALCYQAYNTAKWQLNQLLENQARSNQHLAVVTDIDETVLDNSPYEAELILKDNAYSEAAWSAWVAMTKAKPVPGAVEFFKYAAERGVEVFYVSNRHTSGQAATIENLKALGFPNADEAHVLLKTTTSSKASRFEKVAETHDILLFMGDNLSDFTAQFRATSIEKRETLAKELQDEFGKKFIVLPNPMYGDWESKALLKGRYDWTPQQLDSLRHAELKGY